MKGIGSFWSRKYDECKFFVSIFEFFENLDGFLTVMKGIELHQGFLSLK